MTPKDSGVTGGSAPPIDENYGGTLYAGTSAEIQDPRPALLPNGNEPLRFWVAEPNNGVKNRPAIIWLLGGGFAAGIDSMHGLANGTAREYAQRGYVGFSVEYRIDTTLIGTGQGGRRPPSLCQWVQDNVDPDDPVWLAAGTSASGTSSLPNATRRPPFGTSGPTPLTTASIPRRWPWAGSRPGP